MNNISGSGHIEVHSNRDHQYISPASGTMAGIIRYANGMYEVYDGQSWRSMGNNYATITLSKAASSAIEWATRKMAEEDRINKLSDRYPEVRSLKERLDILVALIDGKEA